MAKRRKAKRAAPKRAASSKKNKAGLEHLGSWAFIVGVVIAVILGVVSGMTGVSAGTAFALGSLLVLLGLLVGLLNITHHEGHGFIVVSTALVLVSWLAAQLSGGSVFSGVWGAGVLNGLLSAIITLVVPATVIVSLRAIYGLARHP
jgi:F0F1-type ATP synthase assembly protein I